MKRFAQAVTMRGKLIAALCSIVTLFLAAALFNVWQVKQIKSELERQNRKVELKLTALELKEMVQELNIIASGLEISKNLDFIPVYNEKRKLFESLVARIGATADTEEKVVWRSKLILLTGEFTSTFDVAARLIQDQQISRTDLDKNMEYLYNESQKLMEHIFTYVDSFYVSYAN
ncbi:hypothetical protein ACFQI7_16410 [Paenibacillus allorhizosphaerae]|uniref:Uncharacterized protein n=1 Tax=Paenibacillus allorhizosphaerae TaxID=2849866 RepID=A0ABN7TX61_9BACL|nr:hypothetical protein [Paenibacillus allorhizosphaerae]CAG7655921.1 hypothetical protein PAECIP111802_06252 [Paenibacillus allorhizosphaerae]